MISKKTISAIEVCLAIADMQGGGPVTGAALSTRLKLSISHLETILKQLKQGRLIASSRGPGGGYTMVDDLDHTSLWDIARVFEKTLQEAEKIGDPSTVAARYELGLEGVVVAYLKGLLLSDVCRSVGSAANATVMSPSIPIQPRPVKTKPPIANSVFQWHMAA